LFVIFHKISVHLSIYEFVDSRLLRYALFSCHSSYNTTFFIGSV
jgi:hypothetical protein